MRDATRILSRQTISRGFALVEKILFRRQRYDGRTSEFEREIVDAGDGVVILPYDSERGLIVLTRQFRAVGFVKQGHEELVEACAGKLEGAEATTRVIEETWEETGIRLVGAPRRLFEAYSTPGTLTERLTYFVAPYKAADRVADGGGLEEENEDLEVFEVTLPAALAMVERGEIIDAKTILLLYYAQATRLMERGQ